MTSREQKNVDAEPSTHMPVDTYAWRPWLDVRTQLKKMWSLEDAPHHSIIGLTGSGKSYLSINGILDMAKFDRVLLVDTKGDDNVIGVGKVVNRLPKHTWYSSLGRRQDGPYEKWFRIVAPDDRKRAHDMVGEALSTCYDEGEWLIYLDECWEVTGRGSEGMGLEDVVSKIWRKGRSRHVGVVAATQTPVAVPRLFYDQASFAWIGRIRDEDRQKRLLEIGGMTRKDLEVVKSLKRRQWLLAADNGEYFARTMVA